MEQFQKEGILKGVHNVMLFLLSYDTNDEFYETNKMMDDVLVHEKNKKVYPKQVGKNKLQNKL